ncbi:MAG TPA: helix-turn-helix domain-containing protein [Ktedonobacteraceae bacterium]
MKESPAPLTALTEAQREQAETRFSIIRPALEDGISQAQVARTHNVPASTVRRWVKHYREKGLAGLADASTRSDKGKSRRLPADAIALIEGLALRPPQRSMAAIHRQVRDLTGQPGER